MRKQRGHLNASLTSLMSMQSVQIDRILHESQMTSNPPFRQPLHH